MNRNSKILGFVVLFILSTVLIYSTSEKESHEKNTSDYYQIKALKLPKDLNFAGEPVPVEKFDVAERIDRELMVNTYWQSNTLLLIKRAQKYFPIIEPILEKNNIPNDFKFLALIESGLQNVKSPAGASGFWQIMSATAKENGLEVNDNIDERYHIEKATQVACDYLNTAKQKFGTWTLAAASYNAGMYGISSKLESQYVSDYYDLLLVSETSRYIPRILAVKEIVSKPEKYGFILDKDDYYTLEETKIIEVDSTITDIALFAKNLGTNYKVLKLNNPWLRENTLENKSGKKYEIKIPK